MKLLHHNASAHTSKLLRDNLLEKNAEILPPPYSDELASRDSFLFPRLKKDFAGCCFYIWVALESAIFQCPARIPQKDMKGTFWGWVAQLRKNVAAGGKHFETIKYQPNCPKNVFSFSLSLSHFSVTIPHSYYQCYMAACCICHQLIMIS